MPRWLPRALILAAAVAALFLFGWWLLGRLRGLLVLLVLAQFIAFALEPAVNWLARRGWPRGLATGLLMLLVLLALTGFMIAVGSLVVSQVTTLSDRIPSYVEEGIAWTNRTFGTDLSMARLQSEATDPEGPLRAYLERIARNAVGISTGALGVIFQGLTVLLFTFYLCTDAPRVRRAICSVLPPLRQREVLRAWEIAVEKTGGYLYSRLLLALASSVAHYVVLLLLDVPYALALALWVGLVSQLVPTIGTYIAAVLPLAVALVNSPADAIVLLIFIVVYQQVENYLLQPRVTAHTLDMHPAVAFGAVIAGAGVLGAVGALLAIPFVAVVQSFVGTYIRRYDVEHESVPAEPGSPAPRDPGQDAPPSPS
jgi:predicted PurR-regulated permease PerM